MPRDCQPEFFIVGLPLKIWDESTAPHVTKFRWASIPTKIIVSLGCSLLGTGVLTHNHMSLFTVDLWYLVTTLINHYQQLDKPSTCAQPNWSTIEWKHYVPTCFVFSWILCWIPADIQWVKHRPTVARQRATPKVLVAEQKPSPIFAAVHLCSRRDRAQWKMIKKESRRIEKEH